MTRPTRTAVFGISTLRAGRIASQPEGLKGADERGQEGGRSIRQASMGPRAGNEADPLEDSLARRD